MLRQCASAAGTAARALRTRAGKHSEQNAADSIFGKLDSSSTLGTSQVKVDSTADTQMGAAADLLGKVDTSLTTVEKNLRAANGGASPKNQDPKGLQA